MPRPPNTVRNALQGTLRSTPRESRGTGQGLSPPSTWSFSLNSHVTVICSQLQSVTSGTVPLGILFHLLRGLAANYQRSRKTTRRLSGPGAKEYFEGSEVFNGFLTCSETTKMKDIQVSTGFGRKYDDLTKGGKASHKGLGVRGRWGGSRPARTPGAVWQRGDGHAGGLGGLRVRGRFSF